MAMPMAQGVESCSKAVEKWFKKLPHAKQNVTKFHFYFHDKVSAKIPTEVEIAQSKMTAKYPTSVGSATMIGDPLTVGQEKYNGSTLSILGRNAFKKYREMPIVGIFRLAQGIANAKTYWCNRTSGMLLLSQRARQIRLTKRLGDLPNKFGDSPAHWLLLGWLVVTFSGLGFKRRCEKCPLQSLNGTPFYASHWISRRSWKSRQ
uniref:Dirigent protein n=1 Tax=Solanum lycopersicum TaxID=4081 RepID=A0A3Q7JCR0_SOLLC